MSIYDLENEKITCRCLGLSLTNHEHCPHAASRGKTRMFIQICCWLVVSWHYDLWFRWCFVTLGQNGYGHLWPSLFNSAIVSGSMLQRAMCHCGAIAAKSRKRCHEESKLFWPCNWKAAKSFACTWPFLSRNFGWLYLPGPLPLPFLGHPGPAHQWCRCQDPVGGGETREQHAVPWGKFVLHCWSPFVKPNQIDENYGASWPKLDQITIIF